MAERPTLSPKEKAIRTADANFGMPSPHKLQGFFHKDNEKRYQEKPNGAQVDAAKSADADSAHPVGFTELFR